MIRWLDRLPLTANLRWLFTEFPDAERVDRAAAAGFEGLEIAKPYLYPAAELATRVSDAGAEVVLINTPAGDPGSPTEWGAACLPDNVDLFRRSVEEALAYAERLRADHVHVLGGQRTPGLGHERAFATYLDNVAWASDAAVGTGVTLLLETLNQVDVPGFVLRSLDDALSAVRTVGAANVRVLFDVYHAWMNGSDVIGQLLQALPVMAHVQVADAPGRGEPGTGAVPWAELCAQLVDAGYEGWVGCEYRPQAGTVAGLSWTATVGRAV